MNGLRRVYRLLQSEGPVAVASGIQRELIGYLDPIYQRIKPEYKTYYIGDTSAEFNMGPRQLNQYDFVDDIRSERTLLHRILSYVRQDDVFYDIGANVGIYSCFIGARMSGGSIVAFEPIPDVFSTLRQNVRRNCLNAQLFNVALSDQNKMMTMSLQGLNGHQFSECEGDIEIETRRADELVSEFELPYPNVCKIDIEGAEYLALDGFRETLSRDCCRAVFCEIHTEKIEKIGGSPGGVEQLLTDLGFEINYLRERRDNYFLEAIRDSSDLE